MPSLSCFWCPEGAFAERDLKDPCPTCGRTYDMPLRHPPDRVGQYKVLRPMFRGFYGATFLAEQASLRRKVVLKLVPQASYRKFDKDWARECEEHAIVAGGTPFVAAILDRFDDEVGFGGEVVPCHVAVLEHIAGPTLEAVLDRPQDHGLTPRKAAQVAADLFEILQLFTHHNRFHNDLHAGNVIVRLLSAQEQRSGAIEPTTRAVAIDLGSLREEGRSGGRYLGDQARISRHIAALAHAVHRPGSRGTDVDYRIAEALRGLSEHLAAPPDATRVMTVDDALEALRAAMRAADEPWRQPLSLRRFGEAYNAQALSSWHIPELWIDPAGRWFARTTARGPQVITGMRGCGKTMLLRALHFHARAASISSVARNGEAVTNDLAKDGFVGVYASCQKLLNPQDRGDSGDAAVQRPFERLYVAYLRDAIQVLRHLRSIEPSVINGTIWEVLAPALRVLDLAVPSEFVTEQHFDQFLTDVQFGLADGTAECRLRDSPAAAFGHLAIVIQQAATTFADQYILFLLDDVSTRYLHYDMVREVISKLLFQHEYCAFRITTEAQALHRVLLSPGGSTPADPLRDYESVDLGNEVYRLLQEGSLRDRTVFVSEILLRRGRQFQDLPLYRLDPAQVLGNVSLEQIARDIAASSATSPQRKLVYRGLRAIQAACVGDLGDVVKLYERILQRADIDRLPVSADIQSDCFLDHSQGLVHFLNRRDQQSKNLALGFAQAAGELLQRSARNGSGGRGLRQYTKLYVRVDPGPDSESIAHSLLNLLDAGVFVYDGGVPRTKTRDDDPVLQFKLSYRKLLGLASFIGLSDRDRFELSGENLRRWLNPAEDPKRILLENQVRAPSPSDLAETVPSKTASSQRDSGESNRVKAHSDARGERSSTVQSPSPAGRQLDLLDAGEVSAPVAPEFAPSLGVRVTDINIEHLARDSNGTLVVALGFERRTIASVQRLLRSVRPRRALLIRYSHGQGAEIAEAISAAGITAKVVGSRDELATELTGDEYPVLVDCTGLSKPYIFTGVYHALRMRGRVDIVHTLAEEYYPKNEELATRGITLDSPISADVLAKVGTVLTGEMGPYRMERVFASPGAPERSRALLASASPKNDRLLHLLDERAYDAARIFVPPPTSPRRLVARAAAELASSAADANTGVVEVDTNDIHASIKAAEIVYSDLYYKSGANVEVGLTGSKIHTVAFGALAAAARISYAWYVAPQSYDRERFTEGVGDTHCFTLDLTV